MNYLSIDVGGTFIKYGISDYKGNLSNVDKVKTPDTLDRFINVLFDIIEIFKSEVEGIGISLPGKIDTKKGIVYFGGSLQYLHGLQLKDLIEEKFKIRCELANDGKAAAQAELWLGNLNDVTNGAAIILGTGVGGGIILNKELHQGSNYQAGELSFLISTTNLVDVTGMTGLTHSAVEFIKKGAQLLNLEDENDGIRVFDAIESQECIELNDIFNNYCEKIANLIINLQGVLDITRIVIGGGISRQDILIKNIQEKYQEVRNRVSIMNLMLPLVDIRACKYLSESNLLGAIYPFVKEC